MDKSPSAFRTISEVSEALEVPAHVLRFWEQKFTQIKPVKRGGGRRYYRPEDLALLTGIRELLYEDGLTIKGVQKVLRERGARHVMGRGGAEVGGEAGSEAPARDPRAGPDGDAGDEATAGPDVGSGAGAGTAPAAGDLAGDSRGDSGGDPGGAAPSAGPDDAARIRTAIDRLEALRRRLRDPG